MRPVHIWLLFLTCLSVVVGAMAWVTGHTLRLERTREETSAEADRQERVRLAMYRLDFAASGLVIAENARPPQEYLAFHAADSVFNRNYQMVRRGEVLIPSTLLSETPADVLLHFQINAEGELTSPQVPTGNARDLTEQNWNDQRVIQQAEARLAHLRNVLAKPAAKEALRSLSEKEVAVFCEQNATNSFFVNGAGINNGGLLWTLNKDPALQQPAAVIVAQQVEISQQFGQQAAQFPNQSDSPAQQRQASGNEANYRVANSAQQKQVSLPRALKSKAKAEVEPKSAEAAKEEQVQPQQNAGAAASGQSLPVETPTVLAPAGVESVQPLEGFWIGDILLVTREAMVGGRRVVQGAWIDWERLRDRWLEQLRDLFPNARLLPAAAAEKEPPADPFRLASLPLRLEPGALTAATSVFWSPLRSSLLFAWICTLAAGVAAALLLHRTVALSERRAAFVSAVTHELRTPLTTFRLYSEMLADDMVPDPGVRREYLGTLNSEATRLSHLVENVLSYSRLERGSARKQLETLPIRQMLARIEPRLLQRAAAAGMLIDISISPEGHAAEVRTDLAALEQVLFNLVDNACKYAGPHAVDPTIHIQATVNGRRAEIRVRDHGKGIPRREVRQIFLPFHKSADAAANSAPGVGLGLALCRRLCADLGGSLRYEAIPDNGACFVVDLPMS